MKVVQFQQGMDRTPDDALNASVGDFKSVMIIGWDEDDILNIVSSSDVTNKDALWLLEKVKWELM